MQNLAWRTGWDSNPRAGLNTDKLISSQPRYDHFDTCPCVCLNSDLTEKKTSKLLNFVRKMLEMARKTAR